MAINSAYIFWNNLSLLKIIKCNKCISREDKEIGSTTAVNPNHEQEGNGLIFDFF